MALWGLAPEEMRPAALSMNMVVTSWLLYRFQPYKLMPYQLFWPLVIVSTPAAFVGGLWKINALSYHLLVGLLMALAASAHDYQRKAGGISGPAAPWLLLAVGVLLGLSAGLTGIGGGVFLSPILLIFWLVHSAPERCGCCGVYSA